MNLRILYLIAVINQLEYGVLLPLIPILFLDQISKYSFADGITESFGLLLVSLIFLSFSFSQFVSAPFLGQLSDTFGRKNVLFFSSIVIFLGHSLFLVGILQSSLLTLFAGRILTGLGDGVSGVFFATISDVTEGEERIKKFGIIASASGLGLVLGALLNFVFANGLLEIPSTELIPFYILLALSFLNIGIISQTLQETIKSKQQLRISFLTSLKTVYVSLIKSNLRFVFQSIFLFIFSLTLFTTFTPAFLNNIIGLSQSQIGGVIFIFGLLIVLSQLLLIPHIIKRYSKIHILRGAFASVGITIILLIQVSSLLQIYLLLVIAALAIGTLYTLLLSSVSLGSNYNEQGRNMGAATSIQTLAQITPGIVTAFIAYNLGVQAPLYLSALLFLLSIFVVPKMFRVRV